MVSAVVLQHGLFDLTQVALDSLNASDWRPSEIILVDNGSPDLLARAGAGRGWTRLIRLPANVGYTAGTNAGWREATQEFVLLCNNDISVARTCVGRLVGAMRSDARLGWVSAGYQSGGWGPAIVDFPPSVVSQLEQSRGSERARLDEWADTLTPCLHYCDVTEATVVLVRKVASDAVGYFDERLQFNHSHDYGLRLKRAGWKAAIERSAVFWHDTGHPTLETVRETFGTPAQRDEADSRMNEKWADAWHGLAT